MHTSTPQISRVVCGVPGQARAVAGDAAHGQGELLARDDGGHQAAGHGPGHARRLAGVGPAGSAARPQVLPRAPANPVSICGEEEEQRSCSGMYSAAAFAVPSPILRLVYPCF